MVSGCALLSACLESARLPLAAGTGPHPELPAPQRTLIPTVNIAPAVGWPIGATPTAAQGTRVVAFAQGLSHPRWLLLLPNGDLLVAESNAPAKGTQNSAGLLERIKGWVMAKVMQRAGAGVPSADRITLLRDTDGNGTADLRTPFLTGLHSPFGMALVDGRLLVANTDEVLWFPYASGDTRIVAPGTRLVALPGGAINHHWTRSLLASADGRHLYVGVGSNSNVAERGMEAELGRASVWQVDIATGDHRLFATGLRNPVGMAWAHPSASATAVSEAPPVLWAVLNERDELGSDLVPDYLTSVRADGFYGWPYSYYGQHVDARVKPGDPARVATARLPDFALGAHVAPLGLASSTGSTLPVPFTQGMFVGLHGSWNRRPQSGYQVVFVPFRDGRPAGPMVELLGGFLSPEGEAWGRPVGVAVDTRGGVLVADDVGNTIWRVTATP
ncbi:sorbosone dehydrogenase family protein [uncultured Hydrogenophaga sp.]|uniref:PQQ-dependent sugar dehydrogenase n=1 Tax=uncultured Hydrogenophaga sp. TaxID=199683 RepID=UPI00265E2368|nr:sorbosone dehydrogenase family protein [uncultured Hydrogenophaga sp.]